MKTMRDTIDTVSPASLMKGRALYEADEHAWIEQQIAALREGDMARVDRDTLVDYLTEMTIRDKRELRSRLVVLLMHLLKVTFQPARLSQSWVNTIRVQQREITDLLADNPSVRAQVDGLFKAAYPRAVEDAVGETGLDATVFPVSSPWTIEEALAFRPPPVKQ